MNKYGPKARQTIERTMHAYKKGTLRSGRQRRPVVSRKQALAIGIETARKRGYKVPKDK